MAGKCLVFLCVFGAVCGATALTRDELVPGVRTSAAASPYPERSRAVRVTLTTPHQATPINFLPSGTQMRPDAIGSSLGSPNHRRPGTSGLWSETSNVYPEDRTLPTAHGSRFRPVVDVPSAPTEANINKMNVDTLMDLSRVSTVEEFAQFMGVELPRERGRFPTMSYAPSDTWSDTGGVSIAARFGAQGEEPIVPSSAGCTPETRTVPLTLEPELNVIYFPTCVRLPRCGGCCPGDLLDCQPTATKPIKLQILRVEQNLESVRSAGGDEMEGRSRRRRPQPENSRRRRGTSADYEIIDEVEHIACACQCIVKEQDCNPLTHVYLRNDCRCSCRNQDERSKCEEMSFTHHWDADDCACYCRSTENCSTGYFFDHNTCSCSGMPGLGRSGASVAPQEYDPYRRPAERAPVVFGSEWSPGGYETHRPQPYGLSSYPGSQNFHLRR